jgi:hypothetical protein
MGLSSIERILAHIILYVKYIVARIMNGSSNFKTETLPDGGTGKAGNARARLMTNE